MVALKGKPDIGDRINKEIIAPLEKANRLSDMPDFNDAAKLGTGKEMVERLTDLISIFQKPELDFSKNRADGDVHLVEPTHNARFLAPMDRFLPNWRVHRDLLNRLPVRHDVWEY